MRTINPEKHQLKRNEILDAAKYCFAEKGFQGTAISSICKTAKVSPGHLYHYFENKEAILGAIVSQVLEKAIESFNQALKKSDVISALYMYLETIYIRSLDGGYRLYFDLFAEANRNLQVAKYLEKQSLGMHQLLSDALKTGQSDGVVKAHLDIEVTSAAILSIIDGSKTIYMRNLTSDGKEIVKVLHKMMVNYLK